MVKFLSLLHLYNIIVLLSTLGKYVFAVEYGLCTYCSVDVGDFFLVYAHSAALNHFAAFALGREYGGLDSQQFEYVARQFVPGNGEGVHTVEYIQEGFFVKGPELL